MPAQAHRRVLVETRARRIKSRGSGGDSSPQRTSSVLSPVGFMFASLVHGPKGHADGGELGVVGNM